MEETVPACKRKHRILLVWTSFLIREREGVLWQRRENRRSKREVKEEALVALSVMCTVSMRFGFPVPSAPYFFTSLLHPFLPFVVPLPALFPGAKLRLCTASV